MTCHKQPRSENSILSQLCTEEHNFAYLCVPTAVRMDYILLETVSLSGHHNRTCLRHVKHQVHYY